ncbi:4-amino-4-deoxy-L-arabinose-phosphoundecaprenol flippase subunit ArnF [Enterobacteriaceae bacterium ESL0689]|nr:4-amino-4-deoxy-L-arabinose-phosphoundecaprenol flippase subunit ArnF [Enterobacteriaceae bacterium ESL0689]
MGLCWALLSVALASLAQLLLRSAMVSLPSLTDPINFVIHLWPPGFGSLALLLGLSGYVLSMGCWYFALRQIPLAKAYALLSLSYIVVWAAAILLPGWDEPFHWRALFGVLMIIAGVLTIFWPRRQ